MSANHLEQLVAEWYEFQGYFVRRNVMVGKRKNGGYDCELDVVAFHPQNQHLVQIEPTMDAHAWHVRERRYRKKFEIGRKCIPELFAGVRIPGKIEQIALLAYGSSRNRQTLGGGRLMLVSDLMRDILKALRSRRLASRAIPQGLPLLRTLQYAVEYRTVFADVLQNTDDTN